MGLIGGSSLSFGVFEVAGCLFGRRIGFFGNWVGVDIRLMPLLYAEIVGLHLMVFFVT